jgi:hypothetical protein
MIDALKIIVARSPSAGRNALQAIQAVRSNSPVAHVRYLNVLQDALADGEAAFTLQERQILADAIEAPDVENRDYTLRVRLTESEHAELERVAQDAGQTLSDYTRVRLFGSL